MLFFAYKLYILLCNGQKIAEYEAYWLMGGPKCMCLHFKILNFIAANELTPFIK